MPSTQNSMRALPQVLDGSGPVGVPGDDLGDERVVVRRHRAADLERVIHAQVSAHRRQMQAGDRARRGPEGARLLGVAPRLDGVSRDLDVILGEREALATGDAQLPLDDVVPGHELGDRVLHLEPRVDFHEVEVAGAGPQELHGAGTDVAHALGELRGELRQLSSLGRRHHGRRRLLDDLLMSPLDRALALAQAHHVAVAVGEELHLDVPRVGDGLLEVHVGVAEGHCADPLDPLEDLVYLLRRLDLLDALAPAARDRA